MKGNRKTPNAQRRTPNAESRTRSTRVREVPDGYGGVKRRKIYDLESRLLEFTAQIVQLVDSLPSTKAGNHIAGQLLRCATSPLANHGEVEAAESRKDFIHKLRICLKELRETTRWLRLIARLSITDQAKVVHAISEAEELTRIFVASVRTTEKNAR